MDHFHWIGPLNDYIYEYLSMHINGQVFSSNELVLLQLHHVAPMIAILTVSVLAKL
jgi:hypothetical protein